MTITVTKTEEQEVEITMPFYSKDSISNYCLTEKEFTEIEKSQFETSIRVYPVDSLFYKTKAARAYKLELSTEKEFNHAYRNALYDFNPDSYRLKELEDKVHDMFNEDDTQNGMIRIGEWVSNFLGHGAPMVKYRRGADYEADKRQDRVEAAQAYKDHSEGIE